MAETRYFESEAMLYAVRGEHEGLAEYLAAEDRFTRPELRLLRDAAESLYEACENELARRVGRG
jgi:hypothetical protein